MGIDIESRMEKQSQITGQWHVIDELISEWDWRLFNGLPPADLSDWNLRMVGDPFFTHSRDYLTFAVMCGVRNYFPYPNAVPNCTAIQPIAECRGLPPDLSAEVQELVKDHDSDCFGHSWLSAKEINEYPEHEYKRVFGGWLTVTQYRRFLASGIVTDYKSYLAENLLERPFMKASNVECERVQRENPKYQVYTPVNWTKTAAECAPWLFGGLLYQMLQRSSTGDGSDVRIVFWFE